MMFFLHKSPDSNERYSQLIASICRGLLITHCTVSALERLWNDWAQCRPRRHTPLSPQRLHGAGEGTEQVVDAFIQAALAFYGERGKLDNTPLPLALEVDKDARLASLPLRYPGKLAADVSGHRLFIADSNNNRCCLLRHLDCMRCMARSVCVSIAEHCTSRRLDIKMICDTPVPGQPVADVTHPIHSTTRKSPGAPLTCGWC